MTNDTINVEIPSDPVILGIQMYAGIDEKM